ncbi:hypothetical protein ACNKF0_01525 [Nocardioides sp. T5]|uniref:hypothetical protein n=1 Tax=Nocardioides sp. T5 TaxID=3400182 RepID=UPI003A84DB49
MLVRVALGAATVVVGFLGGVQLHQVVASPGEPAATFRAIDPSAHRDDEVVFEDCPQAAMAPPYPVNENGMSYGSGAAIDEHDPGPDLVAAYGTNGRCGFIRSAEARNQTDPDGQDIPLYAQDGVTVIGEFRIGPGRVLTSGAPEPARSTP